MWVNWVLLVFLVLFFVHCKTSCLCGGVFLCSSLSVSLSPSVEGGGVIMLMLLSMSTRVCKCCSACVITGQNKIQWTLSEGSGLVVCTILSSTVSVCFSRFCLCCPTVFCCLTVGWLLPVFCCLTVGWLLPHFVFRLCRGQWSDAAGHAGRCPAHQPAT